MFRKRKADIENNEEESRDLFDELNENENNSRFDEYDIDEDEFEDDYQYELEQARADKKNKKKEYYVKGSDLKEEIRKYQESKKNSPDGKGEISEELGSMILKICTRFSMHPRFNGYSYRDEFVADAVLRCITHRIR